MFAGWKRLEIGRLVVMTLVIDVPTGSFRFSSLSIKTSRNAQSATLRAWSDVSFQGPNGVMLH